MNKKVLDFLKILDGFSGDVLEVGSLNVNGTARSVLPITVGTDMRFGKDVDIVVNGTNLVKRFGKESFDHSVCIDTLEHCEDWKGVVENMFNVTKPGGQIVLVTVNKRKGRHNYPDDFWRFTIDDLCNMFKGNVVKKRFEELYWVGVVVKKTQDSINLENIEPFQMEMRETA